jgi:NitT/TauT family transport system substrate-binding protein
MTPHDRPAWYSTPGRQRPAVHKAGPYHRLSGTYPATSLYMQTSYINAQGHRAEAVHRQRGHLDLDPEPHGGADRRPATAGLLPGRGQGCLHRGTAEKEGHLQTHGHVPTDGPATCLVVLSAFNPTVQGMSIDLTKASTNAFVQKATPLS